MEPSGPQQHSLNSVGVVFTVAPNEELDRCIGTIKLISTRRSVIYRDPPILQTLSPIQPCAEAGTAFKKATRPSTCWLNEGDPEG